MLEQEYKDAVLETMASMFSAFASPKRLEIISLLAQGERNVESIATTAMLSMANASQHLQVLKAANLVSSRKDGLRVVYRLSDPQVFDGFRALASLAMSRSAELDRIVSEYFSDVDTLEPMSSSQLLERARTGDVVVIDVRPESEFESGHIDGAYSVPLETLEQHIAGLPKGKRVVAYCRGPFCMLAAQAVRVLRAAGVEAVRLTEGFPEWRDAGLPVAVGSETTERLTELVK